MSAARFCLECLFANVRRQQQVYAPIASSSRLRLNAARRRSYASTKESDALTEHDKRVQGSIPDSHDPVEPNTGSNADAAAGQASKADTTTNSHTPQAKSSIDSKKTLALQRWSALRQSAFLALERQQRDLRQKLSEASAKINDISGYKEIEALKAEVTRKGKCNVVLAIVIGTDPASSTVQSLNCLKHALQLAKRRKPILPH